MKNENFLDFLNINLNFLKKCKINVYFFKKYYERKNESRFIFRTHKMGTFATFILQLLY